MAARAAVLKGAERVLVIDRLPERLAQVQDVIGAETIDHTAGGVAAAELRERTGGRGPDICIEAAGMEADRAGPHYLYDQVKQQLRLETDRAITVREAIHACRKGGGVFVAVVFAGLVDKFPMGAVMNKSLTLRGAQMHGQRYIPEILALMARGEVRTGPRSPVPRPVPADAMGQPDGPGDMPGQAEFAAFRARSTCTGRNARFAAVRVPSGPRPSAAPGWPRTVAMCTTRRP